MEDKEKIKLIDNEIKKLKAKLETTDDILSINVKILKYELIKSKIKGVNYD